MIDSRNAYSNFSRKYFSFDLGTIFESNNILSKLNYKEAHYKQFVKHTWNDIDEKRLKEQTKRNLAIIGERFNDNK